METAISWSFSALFLINNLVFIYFIAFEGHHNGFAVSHSFGNNISFVSSRTCSNSNKLMQQAMYFYYNPYSNLYASTLQSKTERKFFMRARVYMISRIMDVINVIFSCAPEYSSALKEIVFGLLYRTIILNYAHISCYIQLP